MSLCALFGSGATPAALAATIIPACYHDLLLDESGEYMVKSCHMYCGKLPTKEFFRRANATVSKEILVFSPSLEPSSEGVGDSENYILLSCSGARVAKPRLRLFRSSIYYMAQILHEDIYSEIQRRKGQLVQLNMQCVQVVQ